MKIRRVTKPGRNVREAITRLLPQLDPDYPLPSDSHIERILGSDNIHFLVAENETEEITAILSLVTYPIPTGTKFWIEDVVVDKAYRGKGIGKAIVLHALKIAEDSGAKSVDLTSRPFRMAANQMYRNMGFKLRETNVYRFSLSRNKE